MKFRAYIGVAKIHFIRLNQYRVSSINNIVSVMFYGLIQTSIFIAFFRFGNADSIPMALHQAVSYAWLSQAIHSINPVFQDGDLHQRIIDGSYVYDLCRPLNLYGQWFARLLSHRLTPLLLYLPFISGPALLLPGAYRMALPASVLSFIAFLAALSTAILTSTAVSCILTVLHVRVEQGRGLVAFLSFIISFLSGAEVPLPILPVAIVRVLRWLPFAGMYDIPCSLYLGLIPSSESVAFIVRQLGWTCVLIFLGFFLLRESLRRVVIQGG